MSNANAIATLLKTSITMSLIMCLHVPSIEQTSTNFRTKATLSIEINETHINKSKQNEIKIEA